MVQALTQSNNIVQSENNNNGIINDITAFTSPVYEKVNHVKEDYEQKVQEVLKQIMEYKNQALEKGTLYKNLAMEQGNYYKSQAFEKSNSYKEYAIEKSVQYKDQAYEKSKNYKATQYTEESLIKMVSYLENQVQLLNKNYLHQNVVALQNEEKNLIKRVQNLSQTVNMLAKLAIQDQILNVKNSAMTKKSIDFYQNVMSNPKIREAMIFTTITQEFLSDIIQTQLLVPTRTYFQVKQQEIKDQTVITVENVKSKVFKQYIPLMAGKYITLKESTVYFYENKMTIAFTKEFYQTNQQLIQEELKELYSKFIKYQETAKITYKATYTSALESYKKRRQEKINKSEETISKKEE